MKSHYFIFFFYIKNVGPLYLSKCFWVAEETMSEKGNFFFLPQKKGWIGTVGISDFLG